jgi:hypothetical protein
MQGRMGSNPHSFFDLKISSCNVDNIVIFFSQGKDSKTKTKGE